MVKADPGLAEAVVGWRPRQRLPKDNDGVANEKPTSVGEPLDGDAERTLIEPRGRGEVPHAKLTALLKQHILTAADLLAAAKAADTAAFDQAKDDWYANARQIAKFLHDANPKNWPLADLRSMMKTHLDLTLQEASDQLGGNYAASVADYDVVENEILHMADTLSSGIIAQFPQKFS